MNDYSRSFHFLRLHFYSRLHEFLRFRFIPIYVLVFLDTFPFFPVCTCNQLTRGNVVNGIIWGQAVIQYAYRRGLSRDVQRTVHLTLLPVGYLFFATFARNGWGGVKWPHTYFEFEFCFSETEHLRHAHPVLCVFMYAF